ncbi:hypothetical protein D3C75_775230 [compost metagenome]
MAPNCLAVTKISAVIMGPRDCPALPPTWKIDWANPRCRGDAAILATRDPSGWKTAEPRPIITTAAITCQYWSAKARVSIPKKLATIPVGRSQGDGFLSVYSPTTGWRMDAVTFRPKMTKPT